MHPSPPNAYGLIVVGDEILTGSRRDSHLEHFRELLRSRGAQIVRFWLLPDNPEILTDHLRHSMRQSLPVFVCGGIGATPDDLTRACAAAAADRPLQRHPEAAALIEQRFAERAYPMRIRMADLPAECQLIPNPYNQIPGFSLLQHYFLPGFPEMAWPMAEWVLEQRGESPDNGIQEVSVQVLNTPESSLILIMETLSQEFPQLKMFSLPTLGKQAAIELGFRGRQQTGEALEMLKQRLTAEGITFRE